MDFSRPRVIAEYGPGEGVHSREIACRMSPDSHLLLFELDAAFSRAFDRQSGAIRRVVARQWKAVSGPHRAAAVITHGFQAAATCCITVHAFLEIGMHSTA